MDTGDPYSRHDPAGGVQQPWTDGRRRLQAPRPDQAGPRGNPQIEAVDLERGLDKLERVSGN